MQIGETFTYYAIFRNKALLSRRTNDTIRDYNRMTNQEFCRKYGFGKLAWLWQMLVKGDPYRKAEGL